MKLLPLVLSLLLSACSVDCMENIRFGTGLDITAAEVLECGRPRRSSELMVLARLSTADYARFRAEAVANGWVDLSTAVDSSRQGVLGPYLQSSGLMRLVIHGNGSSQLAVLEDSSRKLLVVNGSNW